MSVLSYPGHGHYYSGPSLAPAHALYLGIASHEDGGAHAGTVGIERCTHCSWMQASRLCERSSQLFQDPCGGRISWLLWISAQVSALLLNLSSSDHNVESVICNTQTVISDNGPAFIC